MTWWATLYDDLLADQLLVRDDHEVAGTVAFLTRVLDIRKGSRVFDQCCGTGSVAIPLAAAGARVVGVDQAASYIARGKEAATLCSLELELVAADARHFVPSERVDCAFNWWTSFGYSADDDENLAMLKRASDALVSGGRFALDTMNVPGVLRRFQRDIVVRRTTKRGEVVLLRETELHLARGIMAKRWTYYVDGRRESEHTSEMRLYMPDAIVRLLGRAGFVDVELVGSTDGEPLDIDSPRLIALATRP
jgi:SAM-dependent methyltransferase